MLLLTTSVLPCILAVVSARPANNEISNSLSGSSSDDGGRSGCVNAAVLGDKVAAVETRIAELLANVNELKAALVVELTPHLQQGNEPHAPPPTGRPANSQCPPYFTKLPSVNGCYKLIREEKSWDEATAQCLSVHVGAHLVVVDSAAEQRALMAFLKDKLANIASDSRRIWTAGRRLEQSSRSRFVWKTTQRTSSGGTPTESSVSQMTYTNWANGEPSNHVNDAGELEACMEIMGLDSWWNYRWNDVHCSARRVSVCEIDIA